ncbi:solute carrier family 45 member 3-like [Amphibalanus amphitrite]|uniref:solute carrier family 45 member 3-like n=1 Tax=Amphibalanus amphitrite TaxID=1232801 RepID=UPI001C9267B5|nr:solute carrier family 45 member 3-like [Amphibalanus amphitrite]
MVTSPGGGPSLPRLLLLNMAACGGELGFASVTTIAPTLLRRSNFSETAMSLTMGIGPLLALLAMPTLGRWSDRCSSRMGRRKPFLLGYSALLLLGISCLTGAAELSAATAGLLSAETILLLSVVLCTFTAQVYFNPYQALISDICRSEEANSRGFSVFVMLVNMGSIGSSLLFSWNWFSDTVLTSQHITFKVIAVFITLQTAVTLISVREPPLLPPPLAPPTASDTASTNSDDVGYASDSEQGSPLIRVRGRRLAVLRHGGAGIGGTISSGLDGRRILRRLLITPLQTTARLVGQILLWPYQIFREVYDAPMVLRRLFIVDVLSWTALMSFYMFLADYMGQAFGGRAEDPEGSEGRAKFDAGIRIGSRGLLIDAVAGSLFSLFCAPLLTQRLGRRGTYVLCLSLFSVSMMMLPLTSSVPVIYLLCTVMGCGYAILGTIPNSLVTLYHYQPKIFFADKPSSESAGLGENFAILDMSYCLASILPSLTLGYLVDTFGMPQLYLLLGGLLGVVSAALATTLIYRAEDMPSAVKPPSPPPEMTATPLELVSSPPPAPSIRTSEALV